MKLSKELSWMTMDYINQKVANLALHECIALNDQVLGEQLQVLHQPYALHTVILGN